MVPAVHKSVALENSVGRLQDRIRVSPTPAVCGNSTAKITRPKEGITGGGCFPSGKKSDPRGTILPERPRVLLTSFSDKKASGSLQIYSKFKGVEQGRKIQEVSNGQCEVCNNPVAKRLFSSFSGPQRCLPACTSSSRVPAIPKICNSPTRREIKVHQYKKSHGTSRSVKLSLPCSTMGSIPCQEPAVVDTKELEQEHFSTRKEDSDPIRCESVVKLVAGTVSPIGRPHVVFSSTKNHNDGCQYVGVGRSHGLSTSTRAVVQGYGNKILQQQRTGSSMEKPSILQGSNQSVSCPDQVRQQQCSGLPESSGRNKKSSVVVSDSKDSALGREQLNIRQSSSFEGDLQCCGRLSQQVSDITRRMVSESRSICSDQPGMGHPCSRLIRKETKFKVSKVLLPVSKGQSVGNRRFLDRVAVEPDVCISPNTSDIKGSEQDYAGQSTSNSHSTFLAEKTVVCSVTEFSDVSTNNVTSQNRFVVAGPSSSPGLQASSPFSMEIEWGILKSKGFSDKLSETLIQSRKKVTRQIYQKTWKIYCEWCTRKEKDSRLSASALEFLQDGFQMGLSSSTLKVQTAALSVYLERRLAQEEFFLRFFQGIKRLRPVVISKVPPWDLNVVLQSLCEHPFEPLDQIPDKFLTLKTAFLLAITTARRVSELQALSIKPPYCTISEDRITLRPDFAFLPKVTSKFHRSQEIFLPSFCDKPTNEKERKLHCLDVRRCILHYLERTASWRRSDALLVLFAGKFKGRQASKTSIARWIRQTITAAYQTQGRPLPTSIKAHSTRSVSTSWAERAGASIEQICRAATWSSQNTFVKHYRLNLLANTELAFGRKVLQAVVPP
ncbi:uncharacterized protein [Hyperolius riggenbachi]|uniref:uncharacterized protein n=1 Tax=Hyperolius riggenbachi TaxID=752182 RepID=UPI0035A3A085